MVTYKQVDLLKNWEVHINGDRFIKEFEKHGGSKERGQHIWNKFVGYDHSLLRWWSYLDGVNRKIVVKVINATMDE